MPPKMMKRKAINKMVKKQIAEAIEEYEKTRANPYNAGGSGPTNTGGTVNVQGCSHKTFMNGKPHPFNRTEGVVGLRRWIEKGHALTWWNGNVHTIGHVNANGIPWTEFKSMMTTEYCPSIEIQRMEQELWTLTMKEDDIEAYNNRFHELDLMCPDLVPNEKKKVERYIRGFPKRIKGNITSSKPTTLYEAINMAYELVKQAVQGKAARLQLKVGFMLEIYQNAICVTYIIMGRALQSAKDVKEWVTCRRIVELGFRCPTAKNQQNKEARTRAYVVVENPQQNPNVVMGTFLLNDHYASVLFDLDSEISFISTEFTHFIDIAPATLNTSYKVELMNGKMVSTNTVLRGFTLLLINHVFKIDLLPTQLGSFDVIVGMDWLAYHRAVIDCYEKIIRIPLWNGEIIKVQGEKPEKDPRLLSCIKADKKKPEDIRIVRDFPEVFPDDMSGLPLVGEVEFGINLILGALPVVKSPYRLAPSKMI
ncbi:putative reverse transcriptase domain-containing protein [Tanacetum coccineum]